MDTTQGQHACEMAQLVRQIVDNPEGSPCFLCLLTEGRECVWDDVGDEITMEGRNTIIWHEASEGHFMLHPPIQKSLCRMLCLLLPLHLHCQHLDPQVLVVSESQLA